MAPIALSASTVLQLLKEFLRIPRRTRLTRYDGEDRQGDQNRYDRLHGLLLWLSPLDAVMRHVTFVADRCWQGCSRDSRARLCCAAHRRSATRHAQRSRKSGGPRPQQLRAPASRSTVCRCRSVDHGLDARCGEQLTGVVYTGHLGHLGGDLAKASAANPDRVEVA
jgi:hypothetical protein